MHPEPPDRTDRDADGSPEFSTALSRLEERGAAIFVVGAVPDRVVAAACRRMVGRTDDPRRRRVLAVVGEDGHSPADLLPEGVRRDADHLRVIRTEAADDPTGELSPAVTRTVATDAGAVGQAITKVVDQFRDGEFSPGELRVWVDSVGTLFDTHDEDTVTEFVHILSSLVGGASGRVHYHLAAPHHDRRVALLSALCDATVRLRVRELPEMCWHLDGGLSSGWVPVEWEGTGP